MERTLLLYSHLKNSMTTNHSISFWIICIVVNLCLLSRREDYSFNLVSTFFWVQWITKPANKQVKWKVKSLGGVKWCQIWVFSLLTFWMGAGHHLSWLAQVELIKEHLLNSSVNNKIYFHCLLEKKTKMLYFSLLKMITNFFVKLLNSCCPNIAIFYN